MYRKIIANIRTGIYPIIFVVLIITMFAISLFLSGKTFVSIIVSESGIYQLTSEDYLSIVENNGMLRIDTNRLINSSNYNQRMLENVKRNFLPICMFFSILLIIFSSCLWYFVKHIQNKKILKIANDMKEVANEKIISESPALTKAYEILKNKFDIQLEDYKRLNTYLSHEQKNELAILKTSFELSNDKKYLSTLNNIIGGIDDILTLSENIEDYALGSVDVAFVCAEVCDNYRKVYHDISFDFDDDDAEILAKQRWIYRAISNLLDNAIKYGDGKPIELFVKVKNWSVIIIVKDNGIGIEKENQELIFNNHYRINDLNKNGYGIGLSLVSHVCDLCGGFVNVESELGQGSTFYVSFPQINF